MTQTVTTPVLPVAIPGDPTPTRPDRLLIVTDPDHGPIRVRWRLGFEATWKCERCGLMAAADCPHTYSAGVHLSMVLLGLNPIF